MSVLDFMPEFQVLYEKRLRVEDTKYNSFKSYLVFYLKFTVMLSLTVVVLKSLSYSRDPAPAQPPPVSNYPRVQDHPYPEYTYKIYNTPVIYSHCKMKTLPYLTFNLQGRWVDVYFNPSMFHFVVDPFSHTSTSRASYCC